MTSNGATISVFYRGIEKLNTSRKLPTGNKREDMIVSDLEKLNTR